MIQVSTLGVLVMAVIIIVQRSVVKRLGSELVEARKMFRSVLAIDPKRF